MPDDPVTPSTTGPEQDRLRLTRPAQWMRPMPESNGWGALNTLISGIGFFTFVGWLLGRWLDAPWIAVIGLLLGMASAMTVIWFRYGTERVKTPPAERVPSAPEVRDNTKENR